MTDTLIDGFADELIKLAIGDVNPPPEDPNKPWESDTEARGIKRTANLPSIVRVGRFGVIGQAGKGDTTPRPRGRGDTPDVQSGAE